MGGPDVAIEAAGGMAEPPGAIGTDVELVQQAIERAAGPDGVLVLMDLGSAVMSAEMAAELIAAESETRVLLCEAPLVEGAVAAAARAGAGAPLDEVAAEARAALGMKAAQLGVEQDGGGAAVLSASATAPAGGERSEARLDVGIPLGLHARPAARFVETAGRFDAGITVGDETTGRGPAGARSLSALVMLGARQGHSLLVRAEGPDADAALAALRSLADEGFGAPPADATPAAAAAPSAEPQQPETPPVDEPPAEPPAAGTVLRGVAVAPGIAIGPARRPVAPLATSVDEPPAGDPATERARLDEARAATGRDVEAARSRIAAQAGEEEAAIFDAHLLLLGDAALLEPAHKAIDEGAGAARGWSSAVAALATAYRELDDAYLRERAADVEDVGGRVLRHLTGAGDSAMVAERGILVVPDLAPGDAASLDPQLVEGVAIAHGGATSHAAILARALGIPSAVGLGAALLAIEDGTPLVLDGEAGTVEVDPAPDQLAARERAREAAEARQKRARERASEPARTRDGRVIEVAANIGSPREA